MNFRVVNHQNPQSFLAVLVITVLSLLLTACGNIATPVSTLPPFNAANTSATTTPVSLNTGASTPTIATSSATVAATTAVSTARTVDPAATATPFVPEKPVTLEMWVMPNTGKSVEDLNKVLVGFNQEYPNIRVKVTEISWNDALVKITTALQKGTGPDVTQVGSTWVGGFQATGGLRPFSDREILAVGGAQSFSEAAWDSTHLLGSKEIVAMPWFADTRALFYRTDLLKKANLDPATAFKDWDSFTASLKKMKEVETGLVKAPFAITGKSDWNVVHNPMPFVWSAGGDILSPDGTKVVLSSAASVRGLSYYAGLYNQGLTYKEALDKNMSDLELMWTTGEIGSFIGLPSVIANSKKSPANNGYAGTIVADNMATATIPAGPQGVKAFVGGSNLVIPKASKNQDAAVKLVQYLAGKKGQLEYQAIVGNMPTNKEAQADPFYTANPLYKPFLEQLKSGKGKSYPEVAVWANIETSIQKNFSSMWDDIAAGKGDDAIKARLDTANQEITTILATSK